MKIFSWMTDREEKLFRDQGRLKKDQRTFGLSSPSCKKEERYCKVRVGRAKKLKFPLLGTGELGQIHVL